MMESTPDDLIRAYLKGQLEDTAVQDFERRLQTEANLPRTLALHRTEMAAAELLIAAEAREWFKTWQSEPPPVKKNTRNTILFWLLGGSLFLAVLLWLWPSFPKQTPLPTPPSEKAKPLDLPTPKPAPEIAQPVTAPKLPAMPPPSPSYTALALRQLPDPVRTAFRRTKKDTLALSPLRRAQDAFVAGDYTETLVLLAQTDSAQTQSAHFLAAHALFRLKKFAEASKRFTSLIEQNSQQYRFQSEWGVLMCRLADLPQGEKAFRQQLNSILDQPNHPYYNQTKRLRQKLPH